MNNPIYQDMNQMPGNQMMQRFRQFQQMFRGDPREQIQQMLNSGKVSQQQYNQAVQMAQQMMRMFGAK